MSDGRSSLRVTFPAGWDAVEGRDFRKDRDQASEVTLEMYLPDINVYEDACATGNAPPRTGPTADDLLTALRAQENSHVSEPVDVTVGGRAGVRVKVSIPAGLDPASCIPGIVRIWSGLAGGNYLAFGGPTGRAPIYIVDAPSGRIVFRTGHEPEATDADLAELDAIVQSMVIED